jgi:hypothetical protein
MVEAKDDVQAQLKTAAPVPGRYRHYKGGEYEIVTTAVKEDTLEPLVIYRSLLKGTTWARTFSNWHEEVVVDGKRVKRFVRISG